MTIGERIRLRRKSLGISSEQLADAIGVSRSTMYRYEISETDNFPAKHLPALTSMLSTTPEYIMGGGYSAESFAEQFRLTIAQIMDAAAQEDIVASGIDSAEIYRVINGEIPITLDLACNIADQLGESLDSLLGRKAERVLFDSSLTLTIYEQQIGHAYKRAPKPIQYATKRLLEPYISPMAKVLSSLSRVAEGEPEDELREMQLYALPASAGSGIFLDGEDYDVVEVGDEVPYNASYGVRISGRSMEPDYPDGHIAWVKMSPSVEVGRVGVFILDGEGYIKEKGDGELISLNADYNNITLHNGDDCRECGEVVAVTPNLYH